MVAVRGRVGAGVEAAQRTTRGRRRLARFGWAAASGSVRKATKMGIVRKQWWRPSLVAHARRRCDREKRP